MPTITGEVKRYFRDCGWAVRPPRHLQDMRRRIGEAVEDLGHLLQRSPNPLEVAHHLDAELTEVVEALALDGCFRPTSLDAVRRTGDDDGAPWQLLGADDGEYEALETALVLQTAIDALCERDRRVLELRINQGWTQARIGHELGLTQMTVSRTLARIRSRLRLAISMSPLAS